MDLCRPSSYSCLPLNHAVYVVLVASRLHARDSGSFASSFYVLLFLSKEILTDMRHLSLAHPQKLYMDIRNSLHTSMTAVPLRPSFCSVTSDTSLFHS